MVIGGISVSAKQLAIAQQIHIYEEEQLLQADIGVAERLFAEWTIERKRLLEQKQRNTGSFKPCSCVSYAKYRTGFSDSVGVARNWPKNVSFPLVNGVVITNESNAGHVGYIEKVDYQNRVFEIKEANFISCQLGKRTLNFDDPVILGYWTQ